MIKEKMYSKQSHSMLHDHILDGFARTHEGIKNLKKTGHIKDSEYTELLEKNIDRLIQRIKEFRIAEKMVCIFFAVLFGYLQVGGEDLEMRRSGRRGRRRNESEFTKFL
jgi:hypothetical protein